MNNNLQKKIKIYYVLMVVLFCINIINLSVNAQGKNEFEDNPILGNISENDESGLAAVIEKNVSIESVNFPDDNFRKYIMCEFDSDKDNILSIDELRKVTKIDVSYSDISSLEGIEYFLWLEELVCKGNNINKLDISSNKQLLILSCDEEPLKHMDLNLNDRLSVIYISVLLDNDMRYDLSRIPWLQIDKVWGVNFDYYENGNFYDDKLSYLSGNIVNIIEYKIGRFQFGYGDSNSYDYKNMIFDYSDKSSIDMDDVDPGIFVITSDNEHYVAGVATACSVEDKKRLEYSWVAKDAEGNYINISDWNTCEWIDWTPSKYGNYTIFAKVRVDGRDECVYTTVDQYEYHPFIKGNCLIPCSQVALGDNGYLIGVESYENPNQSYQYEIMILDCSLLVQGLPAWTYSTGKFTVPEGNAGWVICNLQYGYYWTLFRVFDAEYNIIDEVCYGFHNI